MGRRLAVFIEPDGRVARWEFETRSGDPELDDVVARLVQRLALPPPPETLRETVRSAGLAVRLML